MTELSSHEGSITSLAISSPFNGGATVSKINAPHNHVEYLNTVILVSNQLNTHPNLGYGQIRWHFDGKKRVKRQDMFNFDLCIIHLVFWDLDLVVVVVYFI